MFLQIVRKVAYKIVRKEVERLDVTESSVEDLVGKPIFTHDRIYEVTPPGVVMGLAWTSLGSYSSLLSFGVKFECSSHYSLNFQIFNK